MKKDEHSSLFFQRANYEKKVYDTCKGEISTYVNFGQKNKFISKWGCYSKNFSR
jgi:hypothetical protein